MSRINNRGRGFLGIASLCAIAFWANSASAQITPDGTLPNNSIATPSGNTRIIEGGTQAGGNLFHSFQEFSVPTGGTAFFNNALDIQNIISRVTGKSVSNINGLIRANGAANLFLINPNGIIFGRNASLKIGGSFVASTASSLKFADGFEFSATAAQSAPLLTINVPIGLQFGTNPGKIQVQGDGQGIRSTAELIDTTSGLRVQPNQTLALVGGDVSLEGATLKTAGGRIELGSVGDNSLVSLTLINKGFSLGYDTVQNFGNIQLSQQAAVDASGAGGGDIQVTGRRITLTNGSQIEASTLGAERGGAIVVNATELVEVIGIPANGQFLSGLFAYAYPSAIGDAGELRINTSELLIQDGAEVSASTFGGGKGGNLNINAKDSVQVIGSNILTSSGSRATGDAGNLTINTRQLRVQEDGAEITTATFSEGKAGSLTVNATDSVQIVGNAGLYTSAARGSKGDAGDLTINTRELLVKNGAIITASTLGPGKGGNLTVNATDSVQVIVESADGRASRLSAQADATGDAGNLMINTRQLLVQDGAQVSASTNGAGKGGNLTVNATDSVQVIGESADGRVPSSLSTGSARNATGDAGNLMINTRQLLVRGAQVSTRTNGAGKGGNLTVNATNSVQVIGSSGDGRFPSNLSTGASSNATGTGGDLTISTRELLVRDGAQVSSGTDGAGKGGNLTVNATDSVQVIGRSAVGRASGLSAQADPNATGDAGNLTINTRQLLVQDGSQVGAGTFGVGKGGNLTVNATDSVQVSGRSADGRVGSGLFTSTDLNATGDAGDLTINTRQLLVQDGSQVGAGTFGVGKGGNLTVNATDSVQLIGESAVGQVPSSLFTAADLNATGNAGNLMINTRELLVWDGAGVFVESRGTGNAGNLTIDARSIRLDNNATLSADTRSQLTDPNREQGDYHFGREGFIVASSGEQHYHQRHWRKCHRRQYQH
jgi:filamentous hemagglutinin family protein